jgi:hypothetical protein
MIKDFREQIRLFFDTGRLTLILDVERIKELICRVVRSWTFILLTFKLFKLKEVREFQALLITSDSEVNLLTASLVLSRATGWVLPLSFFLTCLI